MTSLEKINGEKHNFSSKGKRGTIRVEGNDGSATVMGGINKVRIAQEKGYASNVRLLDTKSTNVPYDRKLGG